MRHTFGHRQWRNRGAFLSRQGHLVTYSIIVYTRAAEIEERPIRSVTFFYFPRLLKRHRLRMESLKRSYQEKALLRRISVHKDPDAFAVLYDAYVEKIYRFIVFKVRSQDDAEDITSTVFMRVWDYLTSNEKDKEAVRSVSGLLYTTARRLIIDTYRERAKQGHVASLDDVDVPDTDDMQERVHISQEHRALMRSLRTMKQEYQEIVMLRYIDELSIAEIAAALGKKQTNVRVLLHRATKKLHDIHIAD